VCTGPAIGVEPSRSALRLVEGTVLRRGCFVASGGEDVGVHVRGDVHPGIAEEVADDSERDTVGEHQMRRGAVVRVGASGEPGGSPLNTERAKRRIPRRRRSRVGLLGLDGHHGKPHLIAPSRTPTNSVMSGLTLTGTGWLRRFPATRPRTPSGCRRGWPPQCGARRAGAVPTRHGVLAVEDQRRDRERGHRGAPVLTVNTELGSGRRVRSTAPRRSAKRQGVSSTPTRCRGRPSRSA